MKTLFMLVTVTISGTVSTTPGIPTQQLCNDVAYVALYGMTAQEMRERFDRTRQCTDRVNGISYCTADLGGHTTKVQTVKCLPYEVE